MRPPTWLRQPLAALRALLVLTLLLGVAYPLVIIAVTQVPGLRDNANGSLLAADGRTVGSQLIGQAFTDAEGDPLPQYFQSRPSAAGEGYDPTSTGASNLGPEDMVGADSLLSQVCARSKAIGEREGVDGLRPFCTRNGVGAVLAVLPSRAVSVNEACPARPFISTHHGLPVTCARRGEDYSAGRIIPIRGDAPAHPVVPADAVTASGSGLDPDISPEYARLQAPRVARARGIPDQEVAALIDEYTIGRALGFLGEPHVNVLALNLALDRAVGR